MNRVLLGYVSLLTLISGCTSPSTLSTHDATRKIPSVESGAHEELRNFNIAAGNVPTALNESKALETLWSQPDQQPSGNDSRSLARPWGRWLEQVIQLRAVGHGKNVAGVEVGYKTLISGEGKLVVGKGPVRTGVTAILPRGDESEDMCHAG